MLHCPPPPRRGLRSPVPLLLLVLPRLQLPLSCTKPSDMPRSGGHPPQTSGKQANSWRSRPEVPTEVKRQSRELLAQMRSLAAQPFLRNQS